ncbi:MAG: hypothetical protein RLZZ338_724 [Cyanobacteriota bacterium]|jgi:hypothetical protein
MFYGTPNFSVYQTPGTPLLFLPLLFLLSFTAFPSKDNRKLKKNNKTGMIDRQRTDSAYPRDKGLLVRPLGTLTILM